MNQRTYSNFELEILGVETIVASKSVYRAKNTGLYLEKKPELLDRNLYQFLEIVVAFFDAHALKQDMVYYLKETMKDYSRLMPRINHENLVLASLLFTAKYSDLPCFDDLDIRFFVTQLYKKEEFEKHFKSILWASEEMSYIFGYQSA